MKPSKLKRHLETKHPAHTKKNLEATMEASYETALEIANQKPSHDWRNTSQSLHDEGIKLCSWRSQCKENNTIQRRISKMSMDVKEQVLTEIKASPLFSFQLDESTDVGQCSQLLVFINSDDIKDEFLFRSELETTTKADDVMENVSTFF